MFVVDKNLFQGPDPRLEASSLVGLVKTARTRDDEFDVLRYVKKNSDMQKANSGIHDRRTCKNDEHLKSFRKRKNAGCLDA